LERLRVAEHEVPYLSGGCPGRGVLIVAVTQDVVPVKVGIGPELERTDIRQGDPIEVAVGRPGSAGVVGGGHLGPREPGIDTGTGRLEQGIT